MKKIFRSNRAFNSAKYFATLKFIFPEYINPNEKLTYEIRKKLLQNNNEITGKTIDRITSRSTKNFYLMSLKKNIENFYDYKNEILTTSLGIHDEKKVHSYRFLVNKNLENLTKL